MFNHWLQAVSWLKSQAAPGIHRHGTWAVDPDTQKQPRGVYATNTGLGKGQGHRGKAGSFPHSFFPRALKPLNCCRIAAGERLPERILPPRPSTEVPWGRTLSFCGDADLSFPSLTNGRVLRPLPQGFWWTDLWVWVPPFPQGVAGLGGTENPVQIPMRVSPPPEGPHRVNAHKGPPPEG